MPDEVNIEVHGARQIADRLASFRSATVFTEVSDTVRPALVTALKLAAPKKTGKLADRIRAERHTSLVGQASVDMVFTTDVPYARYVVEGTRPHQIVPVNAQALRWYDQEGDPVFAKAVQHPGYKGNPFPRRVWESMRTAVVSEMVAQIVRKLVL
jgi:hypothetical protein